MSIAHWFVCTCILVCPTICLSRCTNVSPPRISIFVHVIVDIFAPAPYFYHIRRIVNGKNVKYSHFYKKKLYQSITFQIQTAF